MQGSAQLGRNWIFNLNVLRIVIGYFIKRFRENPPGTVQNCRTLWTLFGMVMSSWSQNWIGSPDPSWTSPISCKSLRPKTSIWWCWTKELTRRRSMAVYNSIFLPPSESLKGELFESVLTRAECAPSPGVSNLELSQSLPGMKYLN